MKCAADVFIEHPSRGWLILAVDDIEYEELVQTSMLYSEEREKFEQRLANLQSLLGSEGSSNMPRPRIYALLVMSKCKSGQVKTIVNHYLQRFGVALLSLEEFNKLGSALIARYARLLNAIQMESVRTRYFPETEIAPALTTRRFLNRGQAASLPKFYLDADQEWASKLDLEMPEEQDGIAKDVGLRLVNGIAGSGKTLIAINRALMLAKIYPDQEILFLIHNAPVVDDTNVRLHRTLGSIPKNLVIETFFGWVFRQWWGVYKKQVVMMKVPALERFVDDLKRSKPNSSLQTRQILDEIDFIHQTMIPDEATYLDVERIGRGSALQKTQRREMWQYYQALNNELSKRGEQTWSSLPAVLSCDEKAIAKIKRFEHIIVDEAQFFAPSWFELVKQALAINGRLFMCADPNQGFLKTRLSWKKVGLDVTRGRTKWLRHSYRTTRAILQAAHRLLPEVNGSDKEDYLQPDFDGMREGSKPTLIYVDSHPDAVTRLIREIKAQNSGQNALPL
ncbi:UvrD-helicase domain-containing protein, partial [Variovorax sp. PCZ-1]|uniref:UvrD-helicase domain-containing protein n=1 Tax=Variovorax sp. PCZ-1 TaxID=2835533 RepID=UPI001BD0D3FB